MSQIKTITELESLYEKPKDRAINKEIECLDDHASNFIEHSHFCIFSTVDKQGFVDISPKGGRPGFIKIVDRKTLLIPDSIGNNRIDGLRNIVLNPKVGLLFMVSGIEEVVRLKGEARLRKDSAVKAICPDEKRTPKVVIEVAIESLYFHCAKAVMRGKLWSDDFAVNRSLLPSLAEILRSQQNLSGPYVSQEDMEDYYRSNL